MAFRMRLYPSVSIVPNYCQEAKSGRMRIPKISIIMPVYNAERSLAETISLIQKQTLEDFEVICVDDGSTDGSFAVLQKACESDGRFVALQQEHAGAGAARNCGLAAAKGEYVIFSDCDDLYAPDLLMKLYETAIREQADIVACNYIGMNAGGKEFQQTGIYTKWIHSGSAVFNYQACPDDIMRITSPVVWNKLYRKAFVLHNGLKFDALLTCNDVSFVAISLATAESVAYVTEHLIRYRFPRLNNPKKLEDVHAAIESTLRQAERLPHRSIIKNAVLRFAIDHYISALKKFVKDFSASDVAKFYQQAHEAFNREAYVNFESRSLRDGELYRDFCTIRKHDYETMKQLRSRRIIVSLTSYPRRIGVVAQALESIYDQTRKADEVVLWLAEEQFPGKESDLPEDLQALIADKRLTVRWCDDMKGHKKYFYALQEYKEDIVVTIDDDLLYPRDMLETLHRSYLLYPDAVSTMRAHLILVSEEKEILPYNAWIHETDRCMHQPSMQLMASGGAGDLYPPNLYRKEFFDRDAVYQYCLWADNLWVKAMELVSDVPVVLTRQFEPLRCVDGTQEETLFQINGNQNQYDIQMREISEWLDKKFGPNILQRKLADTDIGVKICGVEAVSQHLDAERESYKRKVQRLENRLKQSEGELERSKSELELFKSKLERLKSEIEQSVKNAEQAERHAKQLENALQQAESKQRQTENRLKQTEKKLHQTEESKPIGRQLKELKTLLQTQKRTGSRKISLSVKYLLYYLAWIPEKILAAMMCCIRNGFAYTLVHGFKRLFRRK